MIGRFRICVVVVLFRFLLICSSSVSWVGGVSVGRWVSFGGYCFFVVGMWIGWWCVSRI